MEKAVAPHSSTLAWTAAVHGVARSRTQLSDFTFTFHFHALEKEMATHSSVLAWRVPGPGEPVGCRLWGCTESDTTSDLAAAVSHIKMQVSSSMLSIRDCSLFCLIALPCLGFLNYLLNCLHSDKWRESLKDVGWVSGAKPGRWWWWWLVAKSCPTLVTHGL